MSKNQKQYIYNQPIYTTQNTYETVDYGTYQASNYNQTKHTTNTQEVVYEDPQGNQYIEQPQYTIEGNNYEIQGQQNQYYQNEQGQLVQYAQDENGQLIQYVIEDQGQQVQYAQEGQNGQYIMGGDNQVYEYQTGGEITGYVQQIAEQVIYQNQQQVYEQNPQPQTQNYQQNKKSKYINQMIQQKSNIKQKQQYQQTDFASRNPNMKKKYPNNIIPQNQNMQNIPQQYIPQQNPKYVPQPQNPQIQHDKPLIESEFQPDFQLANSVINQSQIPFDVNKMKQNGNIPKQSNIPYQNQPKQIIQPQPQPQYVIPRRNPNANIKKYDISSSSHYVNTNDPNYRINAKNTGNDNLINQNQSQNQGMNNINNRTSGAYNTSVINSIDPKFQSNMNKDEQPEVGAGISCLGNSDISNNKSNMKNTSNINNNSNIKNSSNINNNNNINNMSNINNNKMSTVSNINNNNLSNMNNNNINNFSKINSINNIDNNNSKINNSQNNFDSNLKINQSNTSKISTSNNNIQNSNNNINISGNIDKQNYGENQMNPEEIDKETPIEEKVPDISNIQNDKNFTQQDYENYQPHYTAQEVHESKLKESTSGDIDDNLDHLPTVGSIMKGKSEMLPPPKKKKYEN